MDLSVLEVLRRLVLSSALQDLLARLVDHMDQSVLEVLQRLVLSSALQDLRKQRTTVTVCAFAK